MNSSPFAWRKIRILALGIILFCSTILSFFSTPQPASADVANDFKASVMAPLTKITDWNAFKNQLQTLKSNGVYALTTDVWWGDVEAAGDNQFDWSYYKTYANVVNESGLKWVPILSTHTCGGNPGDDCNIPIPSWLWSKGSADEMKYKSETGYVNGEAVSPFWSGNALQFNELYASFAANFASYKAIIPKIYLSAGPSGELRYPSYYFAAGWSYPSRGKFQAYTDTAKNAFREAMIGKYGSLSGVNQAWGLSLTDMSQINPPSDGDSFYSTGGYNSTYGKDFLSWYQSVLENHLNVIAAAAHNNFDTVFGVPIGAKISGLHWQYNNPSAPHSAENAAGYYDYNRLIQKFKDNNLDLTFTALEMNNDGSAPAYSMPSTLVDTVSSIAKSKGVRLNGENALPTGNFQKIEEQIMKWNYNGFTLLRLANLVNSDGSATGNMAGFKQFVISHTKGDLPVGNKVTVYYKRGYANPHIYYRPANGTWTTAPGTAMPQAEAIYPGYNKITIDVGSATQLETVFNNGNGTWDNNNTQNYQFNLGSWTFTPGSNNSPGTITQGPPEGGDTIAPSVPANVASTSKTDTSISLSWTASTDAVGVTGYEIWRGSTKAGTTASTSFTDTGLTASTSYNYTIKAFDAAGNVSDPSFEVTVTTNSVSEGNSVTVYYKRGFANPNIHYRPANGTWTTAPGTAMPQAEAAYPGYNKITIDVDTADQLEAVFNNGSGTWDNNNSQNYKFNLGTWTFTPGANNSPGTITQGPPESTGSNSVTVYYKRGYSNPHIHYRPANGTWTTAPGTAMPQAETVYPGYNKLTINIGTAAQLEAVFNNGSGTWDNNNTQNYRFNLGTWTFTPGANNSPGTITQGAPDVTPTLSVDWSIQSIYFIMTDRFSNGDPSNDNHDGFNSDKNNPGKWHGGDFQGIINQLDYIRNMGFTAIWITPVTAQKSQYAYHGYHTYDFYSVDGHLGTMEKFK